MAAPLRFTDAAALCALLLLVGLRDNPQAVVTVDTGYTAAACPTFPMSACTFSKCYKSGVGSAYRFQNWALTQKIEVFRLVGKANTLANGKVTSVNSAADCCFKCARTSGCSYWQWMPEQTAPCWLMGDHLAITNKQQTCELPKKGYANAIVGGRCNPSTYVLNDPHFVGAHGTKYDFSGEPDRAFCLITDQRINVNIKLAGYLDNRTEGATIMKDGKGVRTWIREVGFRWRDESNSEHKLRLVARAGKQQERGNGFLALMEGDGCQMLLPEFGQVAKTAGGAELTYVSEEKSGPFDVDHYVLKIGELLDMDIRLRVAQSELQTPTEAHVHFNLGINFLNESPAVHGLLGQTYRPDHSQRAVDFQKVVELLDAPIAADGESGHGFLDGAVKDYLVSDVLAADCKYATYDKQTPSELVAAQ